MYLNSLYDRLYMDALDEDPFAVRNLGSLYSSAIPGTTGTYINTYVTNAESSGTMHTYLLCDMCQVSEPPSTPTFKTESIPFWNPSMLPPGSLLVSSNTC